MAGGLPTHEQAMNRKISIVFIVGAFSLAAAWPADAQALRRGYSPDSTRAVTETAIPLSDLDPASAAGARALLQRIEAAADRVCGGAPSAVTDYQKQDFAECRRAAISGAVARTASPALTRLASRRHADRRAAQ
jgi:UrcA family protein